ncbi:MAG: hypothetical protein CL543_12025 [Alcanivorax sp.]|nr:hypothetical protein [Alcanivorax sp.]
MNTLLENLPADFQRDGYAVLPGFLDSSLNGRIRASVERLTEQVSLAPASWESEVLYQGQCPPGQLAHLAGDEREQAKAEIYIIGSLARHVPDVKRLLMSESLVAVAELALGEAVRFHFSNLTVRAARLGCSNPWHRDFPNQYCCGVDQRQLRLFICLDGMSEKQGGLRVVPGSHCWTDGQWPDYKESGEAGFAGEPRTLVCPPGTLIAMHCRTVHSVLPNVSEVSRANIIAQYGAASNPLAVGACELE